MKKCRNCADFHNAATATLRRKGQQRLGEIPMLVCLADMSPLQLDNYKGMIAKFKLYLYSKKDICTPGSEVHLRADIWVIDHFVNFKAVFQFHSLIPVDLKEGRFMIKELNTAPNIDTTIQQMRGILQQVGDGQEGEYLLRASAKE